MTKLLNDLLNRISKKKEIGEFLIVQHF